MDVVSHARQVAVDSKVAIPRQHEPLSVADSVARIASHRAKLLEHQSPTAGYHTWRAMHRAALVSLASRATIAAAADGALYPSLLHITLDDLEPINDWYGRAAGDAVLQSICKTIADTVPSWAIAARIGGIEFAILAFDHPSRSDVVVLADQLHEAITRPRDVKGRPLRAGANIGVAHGEPGVLVRELMAAAAAAAVDAKKSFNRLAVDPG